ncbi:MAG: ABC transporter permease [Clostridia bacterium]|nr:ABC transporter permease [Clostridia bacterium]
MKQFRTILGFELNNYFKNKIFMGTTIFLIVVTMIVTFAPRIFSSGSDEPDATPGSRPVMFVTAGDDTGKFVALFSKGFTDYSVEAFSGTTDELKKMITAGAAECAFEIKGAKSLTYYVNNLSMYDSNSAAAAEIIRNALQVQAMESHGMREDEIAELMTTQIATDVVSLGKDQANSFLYTYIMIFALYMVIILYGQMIATGVASEKSSRAMELLITSAKPVGLMFGKVAAACIAGLFQLSAVFGSAILFYSINKDSWSDAPIIQSIFDMPLWLLGYMLVFFLLGFLLYAFMYGAVGSTVSKLEETGSAVMPVTLTFLAGFMVVMISFSSGDVDNLLMKVCSFIPFTSSMAMFTRIAMSTVPWYEIAASVTILVLSSVFIGVVAARIYRIGVLLYGTRPKLGELIRTALKKR